MRLRFAPAPTNKLHIGNVKALIINWLYAKKHNGELLLRIDDTKIDANTENNIQSIKNILQWLNIEPNNIIRQSARKEIYKKYFTLLKENKYIYPCFETKEELAQIISRIYKKTDKNTYDNTKEPTYYRFQLPQSSITFNDGVQNEITVDANKINDPIIMINNNSNEQNFTYLFASSVDDIEEQITHIIRGNDHITNTFIQQQIMQAIINILNVDSRNINSQNTNLNSKSNTNIQLSNTNPSNTDKNKLKIPLFAHYGLFLSPESGEKLSKRKGGFFVENLKKDILPLALIKYLAISGVSKTMNINDFHTINDIINFFSLQNLSNKNITYDEDMLLKINKIYLQQLSLTEIKTLYPNMSSAIWQLIKDNIFKLQDVPTWMEILTDYRSITTNKPKDKDNVQNENKTINKNNTVYHNHHSKDKNKIINDTISVNKITLDKQMLSSILAIIQNEQNKKQNLDSEIKNQEIFDIIKQKLGGKCFKTLRLCLTRRQDGPKLVDLFNFMHIDEITFRIQREINQ